MNTYVVHLSKRSPPNTMDTERPRSDIYDLRRCCERAQVILVRMRALDSSNLYQKWILWYIEYNLLSTLDYVLRSMHNYLIWYLVPLWWLFGWHLLWISEQILSWMIDEFIHWPNPYLLLSATCDNILSWMIEIWMKNHLVGDNNCNTVNI